MYPERLNRALVQTIPPLDSRDPLRLCFKKRALLLKATTLFGLDEAQRPTTQPGTDIEEYFRGVSLLVISDLEIALKYLRHHKVRNPSIGLAAELVLHSINTRIAYLAIHREETRVPSRRREAVALVLAGIAAGMITGRTLSRCSRGD